MLDSKNEQKPSLIDKYSHISNWRCSRLLIYIFSILLIVQLIPSSQQFYLPGLAPVNYCTNSDVSQNCKVSQNA